MLITRPPRAGMGATMYTIDELTEIVNDGTLYVDITQLAGQLLDTLRERDALLARINAALAIEARDMADTSDVEEILQAGGWNAALEGVQMTLTIDHVTGVDKLEQVTDDNRP